jgi:uncharacterized membrane protein
MEYVIAKWLHILSSTLLFGLGLGTAFHFFTVSRSRDPRAVLAIARSMVLADWLFTSTTIVFQPLSGIYLMYVMGLPITTPWILWSFALYLLAGACWLPVVWIQMRMAAMAESAASSGAGLPAQFWRYHAVWTALGWPAFIAFIAIFFLMVVKPAI